MLGVPDLEVCMRLKEWRTSARGREVMGAKVAVAYEPALEGLGGSRDPDCYVVWGDDWRDRYQILAVAPAGLAMIGVRVNVPQEGPRAHGKLVRWGRVQVGELSVESHHGHRYVSCTLESVVLQGVDEEADQVARFMATVLAHIDGRAGDPWPPDAGRSAGTEEGKAPPGAPVARSKAGAASHRARA
jgi:hypothetical protein